MTRTAPIVNVRMNELNRPQERAKSSAGMSHVLRTIFFLSLLMMWNSAWGQNKEGRFANYYTETYHYWTGALYDISDKSVQHRKAKWYEFRNKDDYNDTFDDEGGGMVYTLDGKTAIQAAHAYVDTLYVHKGTTISLPLPYRNPQSYYEWSNNADVSVAHYQRWFDYRTDGNYYCNYTTAENQDTVYDLLTQAADIWTYPYNPDNSNYAYRFLNGYLQIGCTRGTASALSEMVFYYPTDEEYEIYAASHLQNTGSTEALNGGGNDYYVIACDVGNYNDTDTGYKWDGNAFGTASVDGYATVGNYWYEPTLEGRSIFYVVGLEYDETNGSMPEGFEVYYKLTEAAYQNDGEDYLEEYEITFPTRHLSNQTDELVALSKSAQAYAIPGVAATEDNDNLAVTITSDEGADLALKTTSLSGDSRVIQFYKGTSGSPWTVDDGTKATILVTKTVSGTTYHIARYKLTFKEEATPLTQTQVAGLGTVTAGEGNTPYWWEEMTYRSADFMESNYDMLTSLTFSYGGVKDANEIFTSGNAGYYPFPLDWTTSSYAFYDGSALKSGSGDFEGSGGTGAGYCTYAIVSDYLGDGDKAENNTNRPPHNTGKDEEDGDYWIYIDASDSPGSVAELSFSEDLCAGSEIIGTMWVKSAGASGSNVDDAAVLLTIMGVNENTDGTETHTPIYRQCSSQIRTTTYLSNQPDEDGLSSDITGKGSGTNEWFQLYFRFVNDGTPYAYYTLKIDNYCASTAGGDYYIDEVKLYVLHPSVEMVQVSTACTADGEKTPVRMDVKYDLITSRLGLSDEEEAIASVDFIIINEEKYNTFILSHDASEYGDDETKLRAAAIEASIVDFYWNDGDGEEQSTLFPVLHFKTPYESNREYDETDTGGNTATYESDESDEKNYFYRMMDEAGEGTLCVDCYTDMAAYTPYVIILEPEMTIPSGTTDEAQYKYEHFAEQIGDICSITAEYYISSSTVLKVNGEVYDPIETYCIGQTVEVSALVQYEDSEGVMHTLDGVYFDWFFGDKDEYTSVNTAYTDDTYLNGVSLQEALLAFRDEYPDAEELSAATPTKGDFTQACYDIIENYLNEVRTGGLNNTLVLHKTHLEVRILSTGIELVVQPIEVEIEDESVKICFGYVPMTLQASGSSPQLNLGFSNVKYPNDEFVPCLRIGLGQIEAATESNPLQVNLRNAEYTTGDEETDSGSETAEPDHLGVADYDGLDMLYLIGTDDPNPTYTEVLNDSAFSEYSLPVGKIVSLYAEKGGSENDLVEIYFFDDFVAREGYTYTMYVHFEEKDEEGASIEKSCKGTIPLTMKVVPEYLLWQGNKTSNWSDDTNWKRADKGDIHKKAEDTYPTTIENETDNGFVPMLFTKVIVPKDSVAELYMAGFAEGGGELGDMLVWVGDDNSTDHGDITSVPTHNIMYDLMVYEKGTALTTQRYRVNLCDQMHLEPRAQVLHAEQLIYNKMWTDVELPHSPWTLVATPLRDVVSGDWYTKAATGTETAEYFTDITFTADSCDRLNPMVYQRNWSNSGNTIVNKGGTDKTVPAYTSTGWSSVYNDASVSQQAGEGFSIKAAMASTEKSTENLMFRFPKADKSYDVATQTFTKKNAGRLLISDLVSRTATEDNDGEDVYTGEDITVTLTQTGNDYYIIGNPYTAPMSMSAFMAVNTDITDYWTEATYGPVAGNGKYSSWGTKDCLIEPYRAFFVKASSALSSVTFTKEMQTLETEESNPVKGQTSFSVRATSEAGTSGASLTYSDSAMDDYEEGEDAMLMEDAAWKKDGLPLVYTVAGERAVSVNTVKKLSLIPLGVFADEGCEYTLSFVGVETLEAPTLLDTYEDTETPLTEGFTLEMEGASHGRYFIRTNGANDIEDVADELNSVSVYSPTPHTVVVSCDAGLRKVEVYSVGGVLTNSASADGSRACTMDNAPSGIVIVRASTTEGTTFTRKIVVK